MLVSKSKNDRSKAKTIKIHPNLSSLDIGETIAWLENDCERTTPETGRRTVDRAARATRAGTAKGGA